MSEVDQLVSTLKAELRRQGKTYQDLAGVLGLSHASVKRLFAEADFSLARLDAICRYLGLDMAELFRIMESRRDKPTQLSVEQEQVLVADVKLLCLAHALLNKWSFEDVIATYAIAEHEGIRLMAKLDRMKLIELLPGNRYKLLVSRKFQWLPNGPIQQFLEKELQADFFKASFTRSDERRIFISTMLSRGSIDALHRLLAKLAGDIDALHVADEKLPLAERTGMSVVLAARHWEVRAFTALRRTKPVA